MVTGNKYRARADECFKVADSMADPQRKLAHLDLAQRWLRLAAQIEMNAETPDDASPEPSQADTHNPESDKTNARSAA
jgi:hypothetical protein